MPHSHQPGSLKQSNKKHKGSESSKRAGKRSLGAGKVSSAAIAAVRFGLVSQSADGAGAPKKSTKSKDVAQEGRLNRLNRSKQVKERKRSEALLLKRLGSSEDAPKIVGLLSLSQSSGAVMDTYDKLISESSWNNPCADGAITHIIFAKHRTRCTLLRSLTEGGDDSVMAAVDLAKVCDVFLFIVRVDNLHHGEELIDAHGYNVLSALKAVGCPEMLCCLQGTENLTGKKLIEARQYAQRQLESAIGTDIKIVESSRPELLCRQLCNTTPRVVAWKSSRSFMLGDNIKVSTSTTVDKVEMVADNSHTAQICGYLRGKPLPINSLVHIPGVGTCRVDRIAAADEPFPGSARNRKRAKGEMNVSDNGDDGQGEFLVADPSRQDPLSMEAVPDGISGEQTWPTEEEMDAAMKVMDEGAGRHRRNVPRSIPEGMSSYQADWFVDEDGGWDEDEELNGKSEKKDFNGSSQLQEEDLQTGPFVDDGALEEEDESFTMAGSMIDAPFTAGKGQAEKQRLRALANNDLQFPDEMDTPDDRAARERFARYRALQSFRSSPWHPKENLPREYSRIFQFENFSGVQRRMLAAPKAAEMILEKAKRDMPPGHKYPFSFSLSNDAVSGTQNNMATDRAEDAETSEELVYAGQYVQLVVSGLSSEMSRRLSDLKHVAIFALHRHENRLSVLHFNIRRVSGYDDIIKSKDELIFHAGFRTFSCNPIFSEANLNCDKHKLERFLLVSNTFVFS